MKFFYSIFSILIHSAVCITDTVLNHRVYDLLNRSYDPKIRPFADVQPVLITVDVLVNSIRSISERTMDFKLEVYFREKWIDNRLACILNTSDLIANNNATAVSLHETLTRNLWFPDTFLPNAIHSITPTTTSITHRSLLRLQPDGHLLSSRRLSITAECPMDLSMYPFDVQVCRLSVESYGYTTNDIIYQWKNVPEGKLAVSVDASLQLPVFRIKNIITKSRNITTSTGTKEGDVFIPSAAIVTTAWLSLWMDEDSEYSDMISVILAITFLFFSYNAMMPSVSYVKALDIFMGICFLFVFMALVKSVAMKLLHRRINDQLASKFKKSRDGGLIGRIFRIVSEPKTKRDFRNAGFNKKDAAKASRLILENTGSHSTPTSPKTVITNSIGSPTSGYTEFDGGTPTVNLVHDGNSASVVVKSHSKEFDIERRHRQLKRDEQKLAIFQRISRKYYPLFYILFMVGYFVVFFMFMKPDEYSKCQWD